MRKVTQQIAEAFIKRESKTISNTHTNGQGVWLHNNLIAWRNNNPLQWCFTLASYPTVTTRERLNGLLMALNAGPCRFYQKDGVQYFINLAGEHKQIDSNEVITIKF